MNPKLNHIIKFIVEPLEPPNTYNIWCERQSEKSDGTTTIWQDLALKGINTDELAGFFYGIEYCEDETVTIEHVRQLRHEIYRKSELRV